MFSSVSVKFFFLETKIFYVYESQKNGDMFSSVSLEKKVL